MNELPRQKLSEIIARHGRSIIEKPRRVEGLLRDYCGSHRREISVLVMALEEHAVADLLTAAAAGLPRKVQMARLTRRLCDNLAVSEDAAAWSIESWAFALNLISQADLKPKQVENSNPTESEARNISPNAAPAPQQTALSRASATPAARSAGQTTAVQTGAATAVFTVSASGGGDFLSINEALRAAPPNSRLLIREGFYDESIALDQAVEIVGDGAVENIIVGASGASCVLMRTEKAVLRGLTLRGRGAKFGREFFAVDVPFGELTLENCDIVSDSLSCVAVHGANANPTIRNCRIHDGADSGLYFFDNASGSVLDCEIFRNANSNLAVTEGANPAVKNCRIFEGGEGGFVCWGNGAAGLIEECEIFGHRLANVGVSRYANPVMRGCRIHSGRDVGVFVQQNGYGAFEACEIRGHQKAEVVITEHSNSILRNSIVRDGADSGVLIRSESRAMIEDCTIYDNADAGVAVYGASVAMIRDSRLNRNGKVAVRVKERSAASVENCDLRGNRLATWETEHGVVVERRGNRE